MLQGGRASFATGRSLVRRSIRRRSRHGVLRATLLEAGNGAAVLIADDIYGQIFAGGIGIIMSGVVGAFIVAFLIRGNMEQVRRNDTRALRVQRVGGLVCNDVALY